MIVSFSRWNNMYVHIQSFELFLHFHHIKWNYFQQSSFHNETLFLLLNGVETRKKRPKLLVINSSLLLCIAPQPTLTPILFFQKLVFFEGSHRYRKCASNDPDSDNFTRNWGYSAYRSQNKWFDATHKRLVENSLKIGFNNSVLLTLKNQCNCFDTFTHIQSTFYCLMKYPFLLVGCQTKMAQQNKAPIEECIVLLI